MSPSELLASLRDQGLTVRPGRGEQQGMLLVGPPPTAEQAALILAHKPALLAELEEEAKADALAAWVPDDLWGDEAAPAAVVRECVLVPGTDGNWYAFSPDGWATWVLWAALGGSAVRKPKWSAKKRREGRRDGLLWK